MIQLDEKRKFYLFLTGTFASLCVIIWLAPGAFKALALSFGLAYLLDPLVDKLEEKNVPRSASILGLLGLFLLLAALMVDQKLPRSVPQVTFLLGRDRSAHLQKSV